MLIIEENIIMLYRRNLIMFSVISDLFLKAESNITNASKALENEKNNRLL